MTAPSGSGSPPIQVQNAVFLGMHHGQDPSSQSWKQWGQENAMIGLNTAVQHIIAQCVIGCAQIVMGVVVQIVIGDKLNEVSKETEMLHTALKIAALTKNFDLIVDQKGNVKEEVLRAISEEKDPNIRLQFLNGVAICVNEVKKTREEKGC
jgi:hypothetical protein